MTYIRSEEYSRERERPKLLTNYLENMRLFLLHQNPGASPEEVEEFIKQTINNRVTAPKVEAVIHRREGQSDHITLPLDQYIVKVIKENNLSPSGSCYNPVSKRESFLRQSIEDKVQARNAFKKLYLGFEAQGKKRESQYYNQNQANAKIFNNAIAGGMKIKQFILGSKAGFNAITSTGRMSVKQGYSYIERAVNGNIYLPTIRDAITYTLNHARHVPESFRDLINSNKLYLPTTEDVVTYLTTSVENYAMLKPEGIEVLRNVINGLPLIERTYVFYAGCIKNLCTYNDEMMRAWIDSCFIPDDIDPALYKDIDPEEIKSFKGDVVSCILNTNYRMLGRNPSKPDKWNSLKDAAKNNPEGLKAFIYACRHFVKEFEAFVPVLRPILKIETTFSRLTFQHRMARYTVPLSDTDSNIFSNQELIRWKRGKLDFSRDAYNMNAIVTFILSQSLEHVFARLSAGFGAEGKDVFKISMKNEFLYPILIPTSLAKHYLAIATVQEGALLPNPRKDIKGVGFRSSAYPKKVKDGFEKYVVELFAEIEKAEPIRAASVLGQVASVEREIFRSLSARESDYLQTVAIRRKEDYADPAVSSYFYHDLWKEVFAEEYGEMVIPTKCFKIPLKNGKKHLKDPAFLEKLAQDHPRIHTNLVAFLERNPNRDISALLIPPFKGKVHPFFMEVFDMRTHISQVMAGYYHLLGALGIGTVDRRANALVSDFYDPSLPHIN